MISEFVHKDGLMCVGKSLEMYTFLYDAKEACKENQNCYGVTDILCDNQYFWTCQGRFKVEYMFQKESYFNKWTQMEEYNYVNKTISSCAWEKGKIKSNISK